jgi:hypothetical protein
MMKKVIEVLLDKAAEGAIQVQLMVRGAMFFGALRRSEEFEGVYELMMVAQQGASTKVMKCYVDPGVIEAIFVPSEEKSEILRPPKSNGGGIFIPGAR